RPPPPQKIERCHDDKGEQRHKGTHIRLLAGGTDQRTAFPWTHVPKTSQRALLHTGNRLTYDLMAAKKHGLLPAVRLGIELPTHGGANGFRLFAQRVAVLVQPVISTKGLLAALAIESAEFERAHRKPRVGLLEDTIETVVAEPVTGLGGGLAPLG